jgi:hypothetical protein
MDRLLYTVGYWVKLNILTDNLAQMEKKVMVDKEELMARMGKILEPFTVKKHLFFQVQFLYSNKNKDYN